MSYYIGATGEYIWEELLENTTSNVIIATNINFDAGPLTDAIQETITDALGTAVGELIAPVTEVPSATGVGVVALTALGLLSYYKLNRTAVQDVDSMVYSADYASILTPGMFDDRVRIRYDTNWFSNSFYYEEGVKKGELLTYRPEQGSNILNLDATNIKLGTIENARLPADISVTTLAGSGSNIIDIKATNLIGTIENARLPADISVATLTGSGSNIIDIKATNLIGTIENARFPTNYGTQLGIGTSPAENTNLHIYNVDNPTIRLEAGVNGLPGIEFQRGATNDVNVDFKIVNDTGRLKFLSQDEVDTYQTPASEIMRMTRTQLSIYENTEINGNLLLQSVVDGTPTVEFRRGTVSDANKDYRFISESDIFKLQFQDTLTYYGDTNNQLIWFNNVKTIIYKEIECKSNVGIGTDAATTDLLVYKNTNPIVRVQSLAEGTPIIEFTRGVLNDTNKDYRFVSQSDTLKLQYQDNYTSYGNNINQLIWANDTDMIIHKATEFKANVLIGGDTRTIGYVGIGTTASTALHIYTAAANILRLQTAPVDGTNSIEFMRGNSTDPLTDYRLLTDTGGKFKIQYANNLLAYGATDTDLIDLSTTNTIIYKPTEFKGNVGIGTAPHATYKVDVNGTTQSTAFIGNGAGLTDLGADKISTGSLNLDRITLTTTKLYQNFNQINFAIINDKIDLPAEYSINITAYDNPTLHSDIRYKGKMSVSYDDRRNIYKLVTSDTSKTDNVAVLKYKAGDRIHIRNIANTEEDFITTTSGATIYLKTVLYKRAFSLTFNKVTDGLSNFTQVFEWESRGFSGVPQVVDYRVQDGSTFPRYNFTKLMTFVVEAGYAYYLMRLWRDPTNGLYNEVALADDFDDYLRAFGAGQTFRLESGYNQAGIDYIPRTYTPPGLSVGSSQELGGVKPRRGMAIDASTGYLDAIPLSSDLITNMNTSHFTNNTGTNKIDISSTYVAPSATKLATARNIAGTAFDGTENINITYANLTNKPTLFSGSYNDLSNKPTLFSGSYNDLSNKPTLFSGSYTDLTNKPTIPAAQVQTDWNATTGIGVLLNKPTLFSGSYTDLTNKPTIPAAQVNSDWTATTGISVINNKPTLFSGSYTDLTNKPTIPAAQVQTDWNATTGLGVLLNKPSIPPTPTSANLISIFNSTQFVNNTGTSKIDIDVNWKPTTASIADSAMQLVSTRNIAGVGFNGTTSIAIPYFNLDFKPTAGTGITISAGSSTSSPVISATASTPTPATLITILNTNDFTSNVATNKIDLSNNTSNYVASVNTTLTTAIGTKQNIINSTANQIIIGNGNGATTTNAGLTWTGGNTLNATNFSGNGANINNLNAGNFSSGFLAIARGGTGTDTLLEQSILVGNGANPVATYTGLTYDFANRSLKSDRITGVIQYSATVTNITDASIYVSSTPTTTTAITKNIQTINGEYIISTSSTGSSSIIENIFDNTTSSWTTNTSSYVKQAGGTNTTGTNFPTVITTPSLTIYGEWIQVKFPRRTCVDDIRVLPFAGTTYPNSIFRWTLLATNNVSGNSWIRVYTNTKTFLTSSEQSLLPALGNTNTIQYLYYRLVIEEILGVAGSATGSTLSLILLNVKFMVKDTIMYNDAIVCIGEPINTAPLANTILDVNGGVHIDGTLTTRNLIVNGSPVSGGLTQGMVVQMKHLTYTQMDVKNNTGWDAVNDDITTGFVIAITPSSTSSKVLVNMIAHIGTYQPTDSRWWGIKLYRRIGTGAWTEITGANGTETGAAATTAGTPVWVSHNLGSEGGIYSYFVANVTGTYLDAPNTTSIVYYTAYWNQRLGEGASAPSGNIYLNRAQEHGDGYRPAPSSSWTATEIWDLGTPYVPPVGDTTITITSGNVGVGTAPNASYKLNVGGALNTSSLYIGGVLNQFSTLSSRPTMYVGSQAGNGSGSTNSIDVLTSSTYNRYVEISINDLVISYSIIWKNNSPGLSNYYTFNDGSYYVSLVHNLAPYGSPNHNRYTFWRRSGTFVWRVIEFL